MKGMRNIAPFGLRMPEDLKDAVAKQALKNGRSMNAEIVHILQDALFSGSEQDSSLSNIDYQNQHDDEGIFVSIEERLSEIRQLINEIERIEVSKKKPT